MLDDTLGCRGNCCHTQFRRLRSLVRRVETGEVWDPSGLGFGIEALGIAADTFVERGVDKNLDEFGRIHYL